MFQTLTPAHPVRGPIGALIEEIRFADDSPLEESGFEPVVPAR